MMNRYNELIGRLSIANKIIGNINNLSNEIILFNYSSDDPDFPNECKSIIVRLTIGAASSDFRFMFQNLNLTDYIKNNPFTLNSINCLIRLGTYVYSKPKNIIYYTYILRQNALNTTLEDNFIAIFETCRKTFEEILKTIYRSFKNDTLRSGKIKFFPDAFCLDCQNDCDDCFCEEQFVEEELQIKVSIDIVKEINSKDYLIEFFDFSEFFDDDELIYVYDPTNTLLNRLKNSGISENFLNKFNKLLRVTEKHKLYLKNLPVHLIMANCKGNTVDSFSLALAFDKPCKYHRLFKKSFPGNCYKQHLFSQLMVLVLEASYSKVLIEDYIDIRSFIEKDIETNCIGSGGFSLIYENSLNNRRVSIKVSKSKNSSKILNEFIVLKSLRSSYLLEVLGLLKYKNKDCLVMPLYEGGSLQNLDKSLDLVNVLKIMQKVAKGLQHIHLHQIVHQDIKPQNIMLETQTMPRIIDFGLSAKEEYRKTVTGFTLYYSDPDQMKNNSPGIKADIWSFGMVLYFCIFRRTPFDYLIKEGISKDLLYQAIKGGSRPEVKPKFSSKRPILSQLLNDCWNSDPDQRPSGFQIIGKMTEIINLETK